MCLCEDYMSPNVHILGVCGQIVSICVSTCVQIMGAYVQIFDAYVQIITASSGCVCVDYGGMCTDLSNPSRIKPMTYKIDICSHLTRHLALLEIGQGLVRIM